MFVVPIMRDWVETILLLLNLITSVPASIIVVGPPTETLDVPYPKSAPPALLNLK